MVKAVEYIKEAYLEMKRVQFPNKQEAMRLTAYVIGVSLATGLFVMAFDYLFKEGLKLVL
jgi:preprotein translocase SecE subunit